MFPVFLIGALGVSDGAAYGRAVTKPYPDTLEAIALLGGSWSRIIAAFMAGTVLMSVGLALLTTALHTKGASLAAPAALTVFFIGAMLFLVWLGLEITLPVWASDEVKRGSPSTAYLGITSLGNVLFVTFMALAYVSIALYGGALVRSGVARWAGWASLGFGAAGTIARSADLSALGVTSWAGSFPTWILAGVPGWIPLWGIAIGVALLLKRSTTCTRGARHGYPSSGGEAAGWRGVH